MKRYVGRGVGKGLRASPCPPPAQDPPWVSNMEAHPTSPLKLTEPKLQPQD